MSEITGLLHPHGELSGNEVLVDILDDNRRRLRRAVQPLGEACLHWTPEPGANSIALTIWHMGRLLDVFLTRLIKGEPAEAECWQRGGWAYRTGYDPRGIGQDGWGSLNGYTAEEVVAIPRFTGEALLGYLDEVYETVKVYLHATPMTQLTAAATGFDGHFTRYQCLVMALMDNVRHLGEIAALKSSWERRQE